MLVVGFCCVGEVDHITVSVTVIFNLIKLCRTTMLIDTTGVNATITVDEAALKIRTVA